MCRPSSIPYPHPFPLLPFRSLGVCRHGQSHHSFHMVHSGRFHLGAYRTNSCSFSSKCYIGAPYCHLCALVFPAEIPCIGDLHLLGWDVRDQYLLFNCKEAMEAYQKVILLSLLGNIYALENDYVSSHAG